MLEDPVYVKPPVNALPINDPLNGKMKALESALAAIGLQGQVRSELGSFAAPVVVYETLLPVQSLALARMEELLQVGNLQPLPTTTVVTWHRDPLNTDPTQSETPLALDGVREAVLADALGGTVGGPGKLDTLLDALAAVFTELAVPTETVILECRATLTVLGKPGKASSWALVSAKDSRFVALYITSFPQEPAGEPANA